MRSKQDGSWQAPGDRLARLYVRSETVEAKLFPLISQPAFARNSALGQGRRAAGIPVCYSFSH